MSVTDNRGQGRYEITADGELAGFTTYQRGKGVIALMHTEIEDGFEGRGLASELISTILDQAREEETQVLPFCPFVQDYVKKHPDYLDLVPEDRRGEFDI